LTEDSALEFRALKGLPGPYMHVRYQLLSWSSLIPPRKSFYSALGDDGLCKLLAGYDDKAATAVCTVAFSAGPGSEPLLFQGHTEGKIVDKGEKVGLVCFLIVYCMFHERPSLIFLQVLIPSLKSKAKPMQKWVLHTRCVDSGKHLVNSLVTNLSKQNTVSERFKALEKLQDWLRNTAWLDCHQT
jgi:Xanthosine triphosphate pyrophosphatase